MPYITSFVDIFILSFLLFSRLTVRRLLGFHIFLKKKPLCIFTLKARNILRERDRERKRQRKREKETEKDRERHREG